MTPMEPPAAVSDPARRSIAEQKEAIKRMYIERAGEMTRLARRLIHRLRINVVGWDPEEPVQEALCALSKAATADELHAVASEADLWKLFCTTLGTRVLDDRDYFFAQKRGGPGASRTKRDGHKATGDGKPRKSRPVFQRVDRDLDQLSCASPSHEDGVDFREAVDRLADPLLRSIVVHHLEGRTNEEIAQITNLSTRTIERKWDTIRAALKELDPGR